MAARRGDLAKLGLSGVLVAKTARWEDGVPIEAELASPKAPKDLAKYIGVPGLSTLRVLELGKPNTSFPTDWLRRFLFESPLRGLSEVRTLPASLLPALATATPPFALARVHTVGGKPPLAEEIARAFADGRGLPALVELTLTFTLRTLRMQVDTSHLVPWHQRLIKWGKKIGLERVVFGAERTLTGREVDWIALERHGGAWSTVTGKVGHLGLPPKPKMRDYRLAELAKLPGVVDRVERVPG